MLGCNPTPPHLSIRYTLRDTACTAGEALVPATASAAGGTSSRGGGGGGVFTGVSGSHGARPTCAGVGGPKLRPALPAT